MSNELYNTIARVTDGIYEGTPAYLPRLKCAISEFKLNFSMRFGYFLGIAIGGDVFPGSTLSDHVLRFNNIPQVY